MLKTLSRSAQRSLIGLIYLGLACRVLIPTGYMPAPLSEGGPIVLCPSGIPAALLGIAGYRASEHHNGGSGAGDEHDPNGGEFNAWGSCTFGAAPGVFVPVSEYLLTLSTLGHAPPHGGPESIVLILLAASYQARAPPSAQIINA